MRTSQADTIRKILSLRKNGINHAQIAKILGCSRTTVISILQKCDLQGLTEEKAQSLPNTKILQELYPHVANNKKSCDHPNFSKIKEVCKGQSNAKMYEYYRTISRNPLGRSQFLALLKKNTKPAISSSTKHIPAGFYDLNPPVPSSRISAKSNNLIMSNFWIDAPPETKLINTFGEVIPFTIFFAVFGSSGKLYAEAFPELNDENFVDGIQHAFIFFHGLPDIISIPSQFISDGCIQDLSIFYKLISSDEEVEQHIEIKNKCYSMLVQSMGFNKFASLAEINDYLDLIIRTFNEQLSLEICDTSINQTFQKIDFPRIRKLVSQEYQKSNKVQHKKVSKFYHVTFCGSKYSVPYKYAEQTVTVVASKCLVFIYDDLKGKLICVHMRDRKGGYVTDPRHMPPKGAEVKFDENSIRRWAGHYGTNAFKLVNLIMSSKIIVQQSFPICAAILGLGEKFDDDTIIFDKACQKAIEEGNYTYRAVKANLSSHPKKLKGFIPHSDVQIRLDVQNELDELDKTNLSNSSNNDSDSLWNEEDSDEDEDFYDL